MLTIHQLCPSTSLSSVVEKIGELPTNYNEIVTLPPADLNVGSLRDNENLIQIEESSMDKRANVYILLNSHMKSILDQFSCILICSKPQTIELFVKLSVEPTQPILQ